MLAKKKQLFFSHTWKNDNKDRKTHQRVYELARNLRKYGWTTWVDEAGLVQFRRDEYDADERLRRALMR